MYNIFLQEPQSWHFKQKTSQETHFYSSDIWVLGHWSMARFVIYRNLSVPPLTPNLPWNKALISPNQITMRLHNLWIITPGYFPVGYLPFGLVTPVGCCPLGWLPSRKLTYPPKNGILKMIFLFPRWDMLIPWRVPLHSHGLLLVGASGSVPYWILHVPDSLRVHQLQEELEFGKTQLRCVVLGSGWQFGKFLEDYPLVN